MITGTCIRPRDTDPSRIAQAHARPVDTIQDRDAGQQMSVGSSTPVSRWALPASRSSHWTSTPAVSRFWQTRHATDSHSHWLQELCWFRSCDLEQSTSWSTFLDTVHGACKQILFASTEWHMPAAHLILLKAALLYKLYKCHYYHQWYPVGQNRLPAINDDRGLRFKTRNVGSALSWILLRNKLGQDSTDFTSNVTVTQHCKNLQCNLNLTAERIYLSKVSATRDRRNETRTCMHSTEPTRVDLLCSCCCIQTGRWSHDNSDVLAALAMTYPFVSQPRSITWLLYNSTVITTSNISLSDHRLKLSNLKLFKFYITNSSGEPRIIQWMDTIQKDLKSTTVTWEVSQQLCQQRRLASTCGPMCLR